MDSTQTHPRAGDALILVDVQNDFLPGGSLAVPQGDEVVAPLNQCLAAFQSRSLPIFATRDWHPADHCSFKSQGGPWPPHCVAGTVGAAYTPRLKLPEDATIISKATTSQRDAYSGFDGTELDRLLHERNVDRVFVGGLATDYCVLNMVRDAVKLGYRVMLLTDAIRAVNVQPEDGAHALSEMASLGAIAIESKDIV